VKPRPVDPFVAGIIVQRLYESIDELCFAAMGYKPTARNQLMESIVRMSLVVRKNEAVREELDELLDQYDKKYGWLHKSKATHDSNASVDERKKCQDTF